MLYVRLWSNPSSNNAKLELLVPSDVHTIHDETRRIRMMPPITYKMSDSKRLGSIRHFSRLV